MYRHRAESIQESNRKQFISNEEKNRYDNYNNQFIKVRDSYNKAETEAQIAQFCNYSDITTEKAQSTVSHGTVKGYVSDIQIFGKTKQDSTDYKDIQSVGEVCDKG